MAPSIVYTRTSSRLAASSPSVLHTITSTHIKRCRSAPVRSLWWWSRHGTYSSTNDENIEERMQRYQKIMRHRYSRALRRRAMWERDDTNTPWLWHLPDGRLARKLGAYRTMSSTDPSKPRVDEKDMNSENHSKPDTSWKDFNSLHRDYEAFKAEMDRALAKDPYEALFGKRMQSPPSENNSSWISWLFNKGEDVHEPTGTVPTSTTRRKIDIEVLDRDGSPVKPQAPKSQVESKAPSESSKSLNKTPEYVYDPITGRKVPRTPAKQQQPPAVQPQLTYLQSLFFAEHGSVPDKSIKQPHVYGYDPQSQKEKSKVADGETKTSSNTIQGFGHSRAHEYKQLRATILGTSIDTTAVYGGKYNAETEVDNDDNEKKIRTMPELDEAAPLFSGTTYESKANEIVQTAPEGKSSWLQKEGFQTQNDSEDTHTKSPKQKLEPSFDRMKSGSKAQELKRPDGLQPAIDRVQVPKFKAVTPGTPAPVVTPQPEINLPSSVIISTSHPTVDQREDLDLLRASDIRAATRVTRTTRQEAVQAKEQKRGELEKDFDILQSTMNDVKVSKRSELIPRPSIAVSKVAEVSGNSNISGDGGSVGPKSEAFKLYQKPYRPGRVDLLEPLKFKDETLGTVASIFKQTPVKQRNEAASSIPETQSDEKTRSNITESLRMMSKQAEEIRKKNDAQIEQLAQGIRQVYEAENGPIDLSLAQNSSSSKLMHEEAPSAAQPRPQKPLNELTDFFAERAGFLSKVNDLKSHVTSLRAMTSELEEAMANKTLAPSQEAARAAELRSEATTRLKEAEFVGKELDKALSGRFNSPHPLSTATVKAGVPRYPAIERHTQVFEPQYVQLLHGVKTAKNSLQAIDASLHDLKRSRTRDNKEQAARTVAAKPSSVATPAMDEVKILSKEIPLTSPYLLLVYNKSTGEVDQTALDRLPWSPNEKTEKTNPIKIMGNLNYPAAFVTHFVNLEKSGYELSSGGGDMLVFQKSSMAIPPKAGEMNSASVVPPSNVLRNTIAIEEASSQPEVTETIAQPKHTTPTQAATVLDEIPADIPQPGPAAPIAPPANQPRKPSKSGPKVRRQEQVFSGTIPVRSTNNSQQRAGQNSTSSSTKENKSRSKNDHDSSYFARTTRAVKRGVFGVVAFGVAAYTIGAVAEGIGAQAQVDGDATLGPRRKIVMPTGQRPGIYSTESSRVD